MEKNRGVVFVRNNVVEVRDIPYPTMDNPRGKKIEHGVILKVIASGICGSDQHLVRGRFPSHEGLVIGHEVTGLVIEKGRDVEMIDVGDIVSVPFNVACGRCTPCKERHTEVCQTTNPGSDGGAYGFIGTGDWQGGQAKYVLVPYADFNLLKVANKEKAMEKILDIACLSDSFPSGYHGAVTAGVGLGHTVYVAGAGPVGMAAAASSSLLGAAVVIVGDVNKQRLEHARQQGFQTIDLTLDIPIVDQIEQILGVREVDCAIDASGFEAHGHGSVESEQESPAAALNAIMEITRVSGKIGIRGLYVAEDAGAADPRARRGILDLRFGVGWYKSHTFYTGHTPVMKYHRDLLKAIMWDKVSIAKIIGVEALPLEMAPRAYADFNDGAPKKFILDPNDMILAAKS